MRLEPFRAYEGKIRREAKNLAWVEEFVRNFSSNIHRQKKTTILSVGGFGFADFGF